VRQEKVQAVLPVRRTAKQKLTTALLIPSKADRFLATA
jgi:hypothetical protein